MKHSIKTAVFILLSLAANTAFAQLYNNTSTDYFGFEDGIESVTISHNVFTYHPFSRTYNESGVSRDWNEDNNVTGIRFNTSDNFGFGVSYGKNSYYKDTFMVEADFKFDTSNQYISYGASLLLATGYDDRFEKLKNIGGVMPAVYTYSQLNFGKLHIKAGALNMAALAVMIEYDIDVK